MVLSFIEPRPAPPTNPCVPSPCGANSECRVVDERPICSCLTGMLGAPPNCRPECLIHQDCPTHLACVRNKCRDPCTGSCGFNARCTVHNHQPVCTCNPNFEGDPFSGCSPVQGRTNFQHMACMSLAYVQGLLWYLHKRHFIHILPNISWHSQVELAKYYGLSFLVLCT